MGEAGDGGTSDGAGDGGASGKAGDGGAAGAGNASGMGGSAPGGSTAGGMGGSMAGRAAGGVGGDGTGPGCTPNPPPQNCNGTLPPSGGVFIDFSTYSVTTGAWGIAQAGDITGGTTKFSGWMVTPLTLSVNGNNLRVTGTLPPYTPDVANDAENYAGFLFWSAPCLNAGAYDGVGVTMGGTLNGAALKLQVQTHQDFPADPVNTRGACVFMDCATRWSECMSPYAMVIPPPTPSLLVLPWAAFTNGIPAAHVTPEGIVGLQFQFECQSTMTACAVDVTIGTISFVGF